MVAVLTGYASPQARRNGATLCAEPSSPILIRCLPFAAIFRASIRGMPHILLSIAQRGQERNPSLRSLCRMARLVLTRAGPDASTPRVPLWEWPLTRSGRAGILARSLPDWPP